MSILDLPTEVLEVVLRDLDPLGLVSLYQSHPDIADRIDNTTGIWERTCRRYTPADPLKALIEQHLDKTFCFTPDKRPLICLKLAKPFLYVSQLLKPEGKLCRLQDVDSDYSGLSDFEIDSIFTVGDSTVVCTSGRNEDGLHVVNSFHLDQSRSPRAGPTNGHMEFESKRNERCTEPIYETKLLVWLKKFWSKVSCFHRYGNLLVVGTRNGQLRLFTVEPEIPDVNDILTKVLGAPHPFVTVHTGPGLLLTMTFDVPKRLSSWTVLNWRTELLYVARTPCKPISCIDVVDRDKMFSVVCTDRNKKVYRIDIPSKWDTESEFLARVA